MVWCSKQADKQAALLKGNSVGAMPCRGLLIILKLQAQLTFYERETLTPWTANLVISSFGGAIVLKKYFLLHLISTCRLSYIDNTIIQI